MSRFGYVMTTYLMTLAIGIFSLFHHAPRLMWNASASTPVGLYRLYPADQLRVGDLVADRPPPDLSRFMAVRRYLPLDMPLLKFIGALSGQTVCRQGLIVSVDGRHVATALTRDHARRPLPVWRGCRLLKPGELFLLNPTVADSFDGRYFGVLPITTVTARAEPLWTEHAQ
jgi:conjugative transfer signal peptidase TraF